jgi:hypothetical protein
VLSDSFSTLPTVIRTVLPEVRHEDGPEMLRWFAHAAALLPSITRANVASATLARHNPAKRHALASPIPLLILVFASSAFSTSMPRPREICPHYKAPLPEYFQSVK